ncbi:MAG: 4-(cytidine 5'-diphospho)-2-C-methyl-D-erythritol kinase [Gammaproteobacteria bacterium]|nr:4-(cytidine 5'-diphospho)-2-C-methyl-D-erythritol kinase [Gammaproteobacteria bacterium]
MIAEPWPAPAKINHFLHVTGRRADGYHLLQTVFQFLDLADELSITATADGRIRCRRNYGEVDERDDLVVRAAQLLQELGNSSRGADIRVDKKIPIGGGLGGGSSDAATTLVALNCLWGAGLTTDELAEAGLRLGADVPVFIRGSAAWGEGVGEQLEPVELPEDWNLLIYPNVPVATAQVFNAPELARATPRIALDDFRQGRCRNDCEPVVRQICPEVAAALDWLNTRAKARLSGTGASVFAAFPERDQAARLLRELPAKWQGFVTRGCNRSPLMERLALEKG